MRRRRYLACLAPVGAAVLTACGILDFAEGPRDRLATAERRWAGTGMADYEYRFVRYACECLPDWMRPVIIRVGSGRVIDVRDAETGAAAPESHRSFTVPELFDLIRDALDRQAHELVAEYDPRLGYPTLIRVDYRRQTADDELTIRAGNLLAIVFLN